MGISQIALTQLRFEHDKRNYYNEYRDYVNARWKGLDDYEARYQTIALEFCQSIGILLEFDEEKNLVFNATKTSNGEDRNV